MAARMVLPGWGHCSRGLHTFVRLREPSCAHSVTTESIYNTLQCTCDRCVTKHSPLSGHLSVRSSALQLATFLTSVLSTRAPVGCVMPWGPICFSPLLLCAHLQASACHILPTPSHLTLRSEPSLRSSPGRCGTRDGRTGSAYSGDSHGDRASVPSPPPAVMVWPQEVAKSMEWGGDRETGK